MNKINFNQINSPTFLLDEKLLIKNLELLADVKERADVEIILAFKAFAMWSVFDLVSQYLDGATASSLAEARLCYEEMRTKSHTYSVAYLPREFDEIMKYSSHISFNSLAQYERYKGDVLNANHPISIGLRVNPQYSEVETNLYNPCAKGSRLGEHHSNLKAALPEFIEGLHFHSLCENDSYSLEKTLTSFEKHYAHLLHQVKWVNMGGGHLITKKGYDQEHLIKLLKNFKEKYDVRIILEPGSAIAWETGYLISSVLDIVENEEIKTAILDISFTCHQPDTLEMPYRPNIIGASDPIEGKPTYRLGGVSCLAGDFIAEYSFEKELKIGDKVIFEDMMHYTMVKTSMFNGVTHPDISIVRKNGDIDLIRRFGYEDFKGRLS
ncbi:MAG: carboxynorspermidine decarboxylase [Maribacter sp.]|jgi:carboxynorspermidine decarboxylase